MTAATADVHEFERTFVDPISCQSGLELVQEEATLLCFLYTIDVRPAPATPHWGA